MSLYYILREDRLDFLKTKYDDKVADKTKSMNAHDQANNPVQNIQLAAGLTE